MVRDLIALMRFNKPIGIWLLFFPAAWAVAFIAPSAQLLYFLALMLVGAAITRAAGCILNDLADQKLDAGVERTRHRPLASGRVSRGQAIALLILLLSIALLIALLLPRSVLLLAFLALPMIAAYPWMKRITWWPQVFLGLTFNLSVLFAWLAVTDHLPLPAFTLYAACFFWTLGYDTIYAVQDMADDARMNIRSTARRVGQHLKPFVAGCYAAMLALLAVTGYQLGAGPTYALGLFATAIHMAGQWQRLSPHAPVAAGALFRSNQWLGLLLLAAILADRL